MCGVLWNERESCTELWRAETLRGKGKTPNLIVWYVQWLHDLYTKMTARNCVTVMRHRKLKHCKEARYNAATGCGKAAAQWPERRQLSTD